MALTVTTMGLQGTGIGPTTLVGRVEAVRTMPDGTSELRAAYLLRQGRVPVRRRARILPVGAPPAGGIHPGDLVAVRGIAEGADGALRLRVPADGMIVLHAHGDAIGQDTLDQLADRMRAWGRR